MPTPNLEVVSVDTIRRVHVETESSVAIAKFTGHHSGRQLYTTMLSPRCALVTLLTRQSSAWNGGPWRVSSARTLSTPSGSPTPAELVLVSKRNGVATLTMNNPKKLNGWTMPMMEAMQAGFETVARDDESRVLVLTGSDPYYCAGVNLSDTIRPMHPRRLKEAIYRHNRQVFDNFLDFPKPIIAAVNGPAIGASVTSATLCDAIVASEKATFSTPFDRLGVPPEGCSSVHFPRLMGPGPAQRILGHEAWVPTAQEAHEVGLVQEVVPHDQLLARAQALGESWVQSGHQRWLWADDRLAQYKEVNHNESKELSEAFLSRKFLLNQYHFLKQKHRNEAAIVFYMLYATRNLWIKLT